MSALQRPQCGVVAQIWVKQSSILFGFCAFLQFFPDEASVPYLKKYGNSATTNYYQFTFHLKSFKSLAENGINEIL